MTSGRRIARPVPPVADARSCLRRTTIATWRARLCGVTAFLAIAAGGGHAAAQDVPPGIYVGTPDGPQEVAVYATRSGSGLLRLGVGTLDDVQRVEGPVRLICNLPHWRLRGVWLATGLALRDARAKRRNLAIRTRRLTITATFVHVVATEDPARLRRLLDAVGATPDDPAYLFVTMESSGMIRDFVVGLDVEP